MINKITNWSINENAITESDHEIIEFSIICKNIETIDHFINNAYNVDKTDWKKIWEIFEINVRFKYHCNAEIDQKPPPVRKTSVPDRSSSKKFSEELASLKSVENSQNYQI